MTLKEHIPGNFYDVMESPLCACLCCKSVYCANDSEITHDYCEEADESLTYVCYFCGVDAVVALPEGHQITNSQLEEWHRVRFHTRWMNRKPPLDRSLELREIDPTECNDCKNRSFSI